MSGQEVSLWEEDRKELAKTKSRWMLVTSELHHALLSHSLESLSVVVRAPLSVRR